MTYLGSGLLLSEFIVIVALTINWTETLVSNLLLLRVLGLFNIVALSLFVGGLLSE